MLCPKQKSERRWNSILRNKSHFRRVGSIFNCPSPIQPGSVKRTNDLKKTPASFCLFSHPFLPSDMEFLKHFFPALLLLPKVFDLFDSLRKRHAESFCLSRAGTRQLKNRNRENKRRRRTKANRTHCENFSLECCPTSRFRRSDPPYR